ncbi:hypothetical protein O181_099313 [Austropuccinia psidii MF-1]|uniref:Reverse transcriptase Ty1/copia-type domain-containing protein n=1 Tax=Austropuccinia psidii MF-1 TaxID=1389203 RepID=A0A9Q3JAT4_9BASI|nr:hypothetical protein [Austropuccinia psidii MF-1]
MLHVLGTKSFIYNHKFKKDFMPRETVGFHLGVSEDSKGWLFWVPVKNTIIKLASVPFDESTLYDGMVNASDVHSIQVKKMFNGSMISELCKQDDLLGNISKNNASEISILSTYDGAMILIKKTDWIHAVGDEITSMEVEEVFTSVPLSNTSREVPHKSILGMKWVFTKKPERFKAWLVAQGFWQIHGINYDKTFAPTPTFNLLRLLFSTACLQCWKIRTFDVKVAFLHSLIDKPVYVRPPKGMDVPKHNVLKLRKALYGTKQAS